MRDAVTDNSINDKVERPVGAILKETREARGLSLEDVSRVTRIGKTQLQALEEGTTDHLPNPVYARGFLRAYAAFLKLPKDEVANSYFNQNTMSEKLEDDGRGRSDKRNFQFRRWFVLALSLVVIAGAFCIFVYVSSMKEEKKEQPVPIQQPVKAPPAEKPPEAPPQETAQRNDNSAAAEAERKRTKEVADTHRAVPTGMLLKVKITEEGWLDISVDDAVARHYEVSPGDVIEWKADKGFVLDLGNAGGIEAELNGKALKPFGKSGESAHVVLKRGENGS